MFLFFELSDFFLFFWNFSLECFFKDCTRYMYLTRCNSPCVQVTRRIPIFRFRQLHFLIWKTDAWLPLVEKCREIPYTKRVVVVQIYIVLYSWNCYFWLENDYVARFGSKWWLEDYSLFLHWSPAEKEERGVQKSPVSCWKKYFFKNVFKAELAMIDFPQLAMGHSVFFYRGSSHISSAPTTCLNLTHL